MPKYRYTITYNMKEDGDGGVDARIRQDYVEAPDIESATNLFKEIVATYDDIIDGFLEDDPIELCLGCKKPIYLELEHKFCPNCGHQIG